MAHIKAVNRSIQHSTRLTACAALAAAITSSAFGQSGDLGRALDLFNKIQRATQNASKPAPAPQQAPSSPPQQSGSPAPSPAAPAPTAPRIATPRVSDIEPPAGQYVLTPPLTKSKLAPGERIEHDPKAVPKRDPRWAASYENFVPPEATTRYADGPRSVVMQLTTSHDNYGDKSPPLRFKRVLSNPYIPTERVDLPNPNWVISPYYSQGFFEKIYAFSCRPDGTLFVRGEAGVPSDFLHSTYARGIWRVEPDGKIMPFEVFPGSTYLKGGKHTCSTRTCGLPPHAPRERALAEGSIGWAQDKHGNVWGIRDTRSGDRTSGGSCFLKRFNIDGTDTTIQDHKDLCEVPEGYNREFMNPPSQIAYNEALDEVFFVAGKPGGNTDGSYALLKANQAGQVTELLRNWQHSPWGGSPNPPGKRRSDSNQVSDRWNGLAHLTYDKNRAAITFEATIWQASINLKDPGRMYEIKDSFKTLKRLPYSSPGVPKNEVFGSDVRLPSSALGDPRFYGDDQMLLDDSPNGKFSTSIFGSSCFDDAGNRYFMNSGHGGGFIGTHGHLSIRKMDPQGRLSTWVK